MPSILDAPVLQVDANVIHKVDTSNPQNLFSMWTVFARCADSVAQGRRLENLSWRLWTRETFCVEAAAARLSAATPTDEPISAPAASSSSSSIAGKAKSIPRRSQSSSEDVPQLSGSVESLADEEAVDLGAVSGAVEIVRPRIRRQDSCASSRSRGRERHITSDDLEKMVVSIVQGKESLKTPLPQISSLPLATPSLPTPASSAAARTESSSSSIESLESIESVASSNTVESETKIIEEDEEETEAEEAASSSDETLAADAEVEAPAHGESEEEATPSIEITPPMARSTTTVIRGFSPSHAPIMPPQPIVPANEPLPTRHSGSPIVQDDAIPEPTSSPQAKPVQSKKATFALGGSSSGDDSMSDPSQSLETRKTAMSQLMKRKMPMAATSSSGSSNGGPSVAPATSSVGEPSRRSGASEGNLMKSALHTSGYGRAFAQKKQTSFSSQIVTQTIPPAPASHDDDDDQSDSDDIDESAIDDDEDDSSDWEDSNEESRRSSIDDKTMFQRVDSKVHLPSRRSLITLMIQRSEREVKNGLTTSQSTMALPRTRTVHQPPSLTPSPPEADEPPLMMRNRSRGAAGAGGQNQQSKLRPINEVPRSAAQPIMSAAAGGQYQAAMSPRTNRRNMLSTELTESLRRHLLWERSQKTSTANAVLKRRHTAHDVANLKQYPEPVHMNKDNEFNTTTYDQYLNRDAFNGYHAKGW